MGSKDSILDKRKNIFFWQIPFRVDTDTFPKELHYYQSTERPPLSNLAFSYYVFGAVKTIRKIYEKIPSSHNLPKIVDL